MSKYIVHAVFNGTKLILPVSAMNVDAAMIKLRKKRNLRNCSAFIFYNRATTKMVDARMN